MDYSALEEKKLVELKKMKFFANTILVITAIVYVVSKLLKSRYPVFDAISAFSEASMVGAFADWFAVVALFRHPLNIPFPHTSVIAAKKDEIGKSLGDFVVNNFLERSTIEEKLRSINIVEKLQEYVEANRDKIAEIAKKRIVPYLLQILSDEKVDDFITFHISSNIEKANVSPLITRIIDYFTRENKHLQFLKSLLDYMLFIVAKKEIPIKSYISNDLPSIFKVLTNSIYDRMVISINKLKDKLETGEDREFNSLIEGFVTDQVYKLQNSTEYLEKIQTIKQEVIRNPFVTELLSSILNDLKNNIEKDVSAGDSKIEEFIRNSIDVLSKELFNDEAIRNKVNTDIKNLLLEIADAYKFKFGEMITGTVSAWDKDMVVKKIEVNIGRDLQYIRLNGTLVGGVVGLIIFFVSRWLGL